MTSSVLPFLRRIISPAGDWTQAELAEFYRVEAALVQSGLAITTGRGVSDIGEPWFVFCRAGSDEVLAHFARIDGRYVCASSILSDVMTGSDFRQLVSDVLRRHPVVVPRESRNNTVFLHPSAMLTALIATAFVRAADQDGMHSGSSKEHSSWWGRSDLVILSAVAIVVSWFDPPIAPPSSDLKLLTSFADAQHHENAETPAVALDDQTLVQIAGLNRGDAPAGSTKEFLTGSGPQAALSSESPQVPVAPHVNLADLGDRGSDHSTASVPAKSTDDNSSPDHPAAMVSGDAEPVPVVLVGVEGVDGNGVQKLQGSSTDSGLVQLRGLLSEGSKATTAIKLVAAEASEGHGEFAVVVNDLAWQSMVDNAVGHVGGNDYGNAPVVQTSVGGGAALGSSGTGAGGLAAFDAAAQKYLEDFLQNTSRFELIVSQQNIILLDTDVGHVGQASYGVRTWEMSDGSTISIIGILPDQHLHA